MFSRYDLEEHPAHFDDFATSAPGVQEQHQTSDAAAENLVQGVVIGGIPLQPARRSPQFFGPGDRYLRREQVFSQGFEGSYASSSVGSCADEGTDSLVSVLSKLSCEIDASLDIATRQVSGSNLEDEFDLRQIFGREYIEELAGDSKTKSKVTVKSRWSKKYYIFLQTE
jgi:hypothetical protein